MATTPLQAESACANPPQLHDSSCDIQSMARRITYLPMALLDASEEIKTPDEFSRAASDRVLVLNDIMAETAKAILRQAKAGEIQAHGTEWGQA